jgi:hypothetical protein
MQTGNTIFLALGASNQNIKHYDWARSLCSIGCFSIGAVFFSRLHRHLAPRPTQRGVLTLGFLTQAACVCIAAALAEAGAVNQRQAEGEHTDWREMAPIALLSFQAAGQIVASRVLGVNEGKSFVDTILILLNQIPLPPACASNVFFTVRSEFETNSDRTVTRSYLLSHKLFSWFFDS